MEMKEQKELVIKPNDLKIEWYSGSGAGGQHRNKHQNSIRLTHVPSNITVTAQCRSRENSLTTAQATLIERLSREFNQRVKMDTHSERKDKMGTGTRGSYIRSYCFQHNTVKDVNSQQSITPAKFFSGFIELLW